VAAATVVVVATAAVAVLVGSNPTQATPSAQEQPPPTATVERGKLSTTVSLFGTLTYRARADGSPYIVINQARGTYTELPDAGAKIACGDALYRVNEEQVLLLCGAVPAYRTLHAGVVGQDVRQVNQNLHALGYDAGLEIDPADKAFTSKTQKALEALQRDKGIAVTGVLAIGDAVFLPAPVRIARVTGEVGGAAQPGGHVVDATSDTPEVQVALDPSQQGDIKEGDAAQILLPGNRSVSGKVDRLGTVAQVPPGPGANAAATIPAYVSLDDPAGAQGFDAAPVQVDIRTEGVENALSVPVTALVGKSGGGFAVEVIRADAQHELVAVKLGVFDTTAGRVQVEGELSEGDHVVVPSP
jgi:peptidoglycan hydrolase-like protein with peptidoglycan-binding domain